MIRSYPRTSSGCVETYPHTHTFVGVPGGSELLVLLLLAVLLFGADRLPKLARSSGQAMGEFRKGREAVEAEVWAAREGSLEAETDTAVAEISTHEF